MWDEPDGRLRCRNTRSSRHHKRCWFIQTAGRWPWKSESAKKCVTTYLPNELALKMDGAQACYPNLPVASKVARLQRVGGRGGDLGTEALAVRLRGTAPGADLGGSSKYSNGNFED